MKKLRSTDGSIYDLGDGRKKVVVTIGYHPATGAQIRASETIRGTDRDAKRALERLNRKKGRVPSSLGKLSVAEFVEVEYLPSLELSENTRAGYDATLRNHIQPRFSSVKVEEASPLFIKRMLAEIPAIGARLNAYKMLRAAFNVAVDEGALERNPMRRVPKPELPDYEADVYTLQEALEALEFARGSDIEQGIFVAACGLRASETCAQNRQDIVLERQPTGEVLGELTVDEGYHRLKGERFMRNPKSKRSKRTVAIPGFIAERLLEILGEHRIGPLMVDATGQRMTPGGFSHRWRRLMLVRHNKKGDVIYQPPVRFIELKNWRHTQSTILLDEGATMHQVSLRDGHSDERITDKSYNKAHRRNVADHAVAGILDAAVRRAKSAEHSKDSAGAN